MLSHRLLPFWKYAVARDVAKVVGDVDASTLTSTTDVHFVDILAVAVFLSEITDTEVLHGAQARMSI